MKCYLFVSFLLLNNLRRFFSSKNAPPYLKVCFYFMISLFTTVEGTSSQSRQWKSDSQPHNELFGDAPRSRADWACAAL